MYRLPKILFLFVAISQTVFANIQSKFNEISEKDRISLERFFQLLIREEAFGYTLFGLKPISLADFAPPSYKFVHLAKSYILEKGWEAWCRNRHLFPSDHFILKQERDQEFKTLHFILINKPLCLKSIQKYLLDFQFFFNGTAEQILEELCGQENAMHHLSQFLIGILLGYGENNAANFEKERRLCREISGKMTPPFLMEKEFSLLRPMGRDFAKRCPFDKTLFLPKKRTSLVVEFNELYDQREFFEFTHSEPMLDFFSPPCFICWENCADLKIAYTKTKLRIQKAYQKGDFLEVTLQQWMAPE